MERITLKGQKKGRGERLIAACGTHTAVTTTTFILSTFQRMTGVKVRSEFELQTCLPVWNFLRTHPTKP